MEKNEDGKLHTRREDLFRKETQQVSFLRIVVVGVLLCVGAVVSLCIFLIASDAEQDAFVAEFHTASVIIVGK